MQSTTFKELTIKEAWKCIGFAGLKDTPLKTGEISITKTKQGVVIITSCRNCGDYTRVYLSKRRLQSILKQL